VLLMLRHHGLRDLQRDLRELQQLLEELQQALKATKNGLWINLLRSDNH
jgi:hypothetical protein